MDKGFSDVRHIFHVLLIFRVQHLGDLMGVGLLEYVDQEVMRPDAFSMLIYKLDFDHVINVGYAARRTSGRRSHAENEADY